MTTVKPYLFKTQEYASDFLTGSKRMVWNEDELEDIYEKMLFDGLIGKLPVYSVAALAEKFDTTVGHIDVLIKRAQISEYKVWCRSKDYQFKRLIVISESGFQKLSQKIKADEKTKAKKAKAVKQSKEEWLEEQKRLHPLVKDVRFFDPNFYVDPTPLCFADIDDIDDKDLL